jgi:Zn-dependent protease
MIFDRDISSLLLLLPPLLFSLTIHEFSHAYAATLLGDNTARDAGRLSLNPIRHLDPLGTLFILMSFLIGWAKPVPVDPRNFRNPARDMSIVAAAGPAANLATALLMAVLLHAVMGAGALRSMPGFFAEPLFAMAFTAFWLNVGLCLFNLLPIPPLDGFNLLSYFLPREAAMFMLRYRAVFFVALLVLIATGLLQDILGPTLRLIGRKLLPEGAV